MITITNIILSSFLFGAAVVAIIAIHNVRRLLQQYTMLMQYAAKQEEELRKLYQRFSVGCIEINSILYTVEYVTKYKVDQNLDFSETIRNLLLQHNFGKPDWDEQRFRSDAETKGIFNIIIALRTSL